MDLEAYRRAYFADPPPEPRFAFTGAFGATLYVQDHAAAVAFCADAVAFCADAVAFYAATVAVHAAPLP